MKIYFFYFSFTVVSTCLNLIHLIEFLVIHLSRCQFEVSAVLNKIKFSFLCCFILSKLFALVNLKQNIKIFLTFSHSIFYNNEKMFKVWEHCEIESKEEIEFWSKINWKIMIWCVLSTSMLMNSSCCWYKFYGIWKCLTVS